MKHLVYCFALLLPVFISLSYSQEPGDSISVTHSAGNADGNVYVTVDDPSQLTGHDYKVSFHTQQQIRDPNGDWIPASINKKNYYPGNPDTLTGTTIDAAAVYGPTAGTTELRFHLDVVHHYYGWVDGVILTFPPNVTIISSPPFEAGGGWVEPEIIGQEIHYGVTDGSQTQNGVFHEGGEDWIVIVATINNILPVTIDWIAFDDGYAGGQNETGTTTVTEVGYASRLAKLWNLLDVTTGELALEDISIVNGIDLYPTREGDPIIVPNPIVDGFQINVDVSYDPPIEFASLELYSPSGLTILTSNSSTTTLDIQNYTIFNTISSKAIDNFGIGTNELSELQQDYELRFTGVYDQGTIINGQLVYQVVSGGQMATVFRMISAGALADHPLNPNPGVAEPFLIRIPFEVWNVDDPQNPYQVNFTFRDRVRVGTEDPFWAWNPTNRMYAIYVNSPYNPTQVIQVDNGPDPFNDPATWVTVHYGTNYHLDDIVTIFYEGPIQFGVDEFTFTTPNPVVSVEDESIVSTYELFQNYPNPFNPSTTIKFSLPLSGYVTLKVLNTLGEEITVLMYNEMNVGSYKIEWDARNYPSGVYFYQLKSQNFIETKKMILMK